MNDEKLRGMIHQAVNHRLSGVQYDPWLAQRVIETAKGEKPVKKKISMTLILALTLMLMVSVALAAGLGLFGQMAEHDDADARLGTLDSLSQKMDIGITTEDGITVAIEQAYYEGNRVFIAYRESGNLFSADLHEGTPPADTPWDWEEKDFIYSQNMASEAPQERKVIEWLNGEGQRWAECRNASLHDGLSLADGTYLDIVNGDTTWLEDGTVIGWKECEIPEDRLTDTLDFKAVLFRTATIKFQDGTTFRSHTDRGEQTDIPFTLQQNKQFTYLEGSFTGSDYSVRAEFVQGQIDLRGTLTMTCPEAWVTVWNTWENPDSIDMIEHWVLYDGETEISSAGTQAIGAEGTDTMLCEQLYPCQQDTSKLRLVPVYTQSGLHPEEAIPLTLVVNR